MEIELEICPVCDTKNYQSHALGGECLSCGWYPISITYDEEDIIEAKNKLKNKMNEQDKLYIETHRAWVKSTRLNAVEHELNMLHNQKLISLYTEQMNLDKRQMELSINYVESGEVAFLEWCKNNNIDPNVEL